MFFYDSEVSFWGPGGSFLWSWITILVIQWSTGTLPGRPWGPDLDFIDFGCVLGPPWEALSGHLGFFVVILDVQMACGIIYIFRKTFC